MVHMVHRDDQLYVETSRRRKREIFSPQVPFRLVQYSGQKVICASFRITSRSHATVARHGMQLISAQERSGAHRNDHHTINLPAGLL